MKGEIYEIILEKSNKKTNLYLVMFFNFKFYFKKKKTATIIFVIIKPKIYFLNLNFERQILLQLKL